MSMYFDTKPKTFREDLYNYEDELNKLLSCLRGEPDRPPLVAILGHRRTGKTSLLKTSLNEVEQPYLVADGREYLNKNSIRKIEFMRKFERALNTALQKQKSFGEKLVETLKDVSWVKAGVTGTVPSIQFKWEKDSDWLDPLEILQDVNDVIDESEEDECFILALDEAQEFARISNLDIQKMLAYTYDNLKNIQIVLTGSCVRVAKELMEEDDPQAPLFGRTSIKVKTSKLSKEEAIDFLQKGFEETELDPDREMLEDVVDNLDGIIGWLTQFGNKSMEKGKVDLKTLRRTMEDGAKLVASEFEQYLETKRADEKYRAILKAVKKSDNKRWGEIKERVEYRLKNRMTDSNFSKFLRSLTRYGFLEKQDKQYIVPDPMMEKAVEDELI